MMRVEMVDIFRRSEAVAGIVEEAHGEACPKLKVIWMQLGVEDEAAAAKARAAGVIGRAETVARRSRRGGLGL